MTPGKTDTNKQQSGDLEQRQGGPPPPATLKSKAPIIAAFIAIVIAAGLMVLLTRACGGDQPAPTATVIQQAPGPIQR